MRTLSIRQPYVEAILGRADDGNPIGKRVENRSWAGCNIRGPLLVHASKTCTKAAFAEGVGFIQDVLKAEGRTATIPPLAELPQGGIVGMVRLVGVEEHPTAWALDGSPIDAVALDEERPRGCSACGAEGCDDCGGSGIAGGWRTSKGWAIGGALGLRLADAHALPFVPWKGSRNFFEVPLQSLPTDYHAVAQILEDAERSRLTLSRDERRLLEAACGNGSGHPEDRRPGLLAVRCHVDEVAAELRSRGLLVRVRHLGTHALHQVTRDGRRAMDGGRS